MLLSRIEVDRLRNLRQVRLELSPGLTVISGHNGHGKSSLLEAIYLLATGSSFRTRRLEEVVAWEGGPVRVVGGVVGASGSGDLRVYIGDEGRHLFADERELVLEDYLGRLDVVDLTAPRMHILTGGPEQRRRFLDRGVLGFRPAYLRALGDYRRILQQRNALLRRVGASLPESSRRELGVWTERMIPAARQLHDQRCRYAARLAEVLEEVAPRILPPGRTLALRYRPSPAGSESLTGDEFAAYLSEKMRDNSERDLELGYTRLGPHRDDAGVELDGIDLRKYGSAGQLRASLICLKLSKLSLLRRDRVEPPLFLMDDFDSDLDEVRASALAGFLEAGAFQTLVATSKEGLVERLELSSMKVTRVAMNDGRACAG